MSTEVTPYANASLQERRTYAETLAQAGDLIPRGLHYQPRDPQTNAAKGPPVPSPGKVLLVMETGAMLGIHPIAALQGIHVIEGKASLSASMMSAVVRQAGHTLKVWTEGSVEDDDFRAIATLVRKGDDFEYRSEWTKERATRAGLVEKDNWKHYFEAMCKNRSISDVCRDGASDALAGVIYTPDELGAVVNDRDDVIEGEVLEVTEPSALPKESKRPATGRQGTRKAPKKAAPVAEPQQEAPVPETAAQPVEAPVAAAPVHSSVHFEPGPDPEPEPESDEDIQDAEEVYDDGPAAVLAPDAPDEPHPFIVAREEEPTNWTRQLAAATEIPQVKQVWDESAAVGDLTTELRSAVLARKAEVEAA